MRLRINPSLFPHDASLLPLMSARVANGNDTDGHRRKSIDPEEPSGWQSNKSRTGSSLLPRRRPGSQSPDRRPTRWRHAASYRERSGLAAPCASLSRSSTDGLRRTQRPGRVPRRDGIPRRARTVGAAGAAMTWTKTPDDWPDRLFDLSDSAYRLHHAATTFCNRLLLDGSLPKVRLAMVPVPQRARRPPIVRELIDAGLWLESADGWELLDFFDAQLSAEEVTARREYDAVRQRIRFATTAKTRQFCVPWRTSRSALCSMHANGDVHEPHNVSHTVSHNAPARSVPTRPVPTPRRARTGGGRRRRLTAPRRPKRVTLLLCSIDSAMRRYTPAGTTGSPRPLTVARLEEVHESCLNRYRDGDVSLPIIAKLHRRGPGTVLPLPPGEK